MNIQFSGSLCDHGSMRSYLVQICDITSTISCAFINRSMDIHTRTWLLHFFSGPFSE